MAVLWVESTGDYAAFALCPDGCVLTWNPGGEKILGYGADEVRGQSFAVLYPDADRLAGTPDAALSMARERGRHQGEVVPASRWRYLVGALTITALWDAGGPPDGFSVVIRDDSEHKLIHEAVVESERRFRLLVD